MDDPDKLRKIDKYHIIQLAIESSIGIIKSKDTIADDVIKLTEKYSSHWPTQISKQEIVDVLTTSPHTLIFNGWFNND